MVFEMVEAAKLGFSDGCIIAFLQYPSRLFWFAAIALPVVIHLWNQRKKQELPWAAMDFLNAAVHEDSKRIRFETLLLLFVRCALIGCFVIAICQPKIESMSTSSTGRRSHVVFVVDTSFSMAVRENGVALIDEAKRSIKRLIDDQPDAYVYSLIALNYEGAQTVGFPSPGNRDFMEKLNRLTVEARAANLERTLDSVSIVLENAKQLEPEIDFQHVVFFF